ncbi:hypothetical protein RRG08_030801 [Elysia crispata]|uniref:Uncharacterized protein n=1 Tax=Elysia crispata TaxID=231223 RepID=A0AAE0YFN5_9GAST|nr:hypothetical protein RRG08_030801 [Elysia crispata]
MDLTRDKRQWFIYNIFGTFSQSLVVHLQLKQYLINFRLKNSSLDNTMAFSVRAVLVNGASRGLGLELVSQFLALPTPPELVIGTCRSPDTATRLQDMARTNPSLKIIKLDIENDDDIENAFKVNSFYYQQSR